MVVRQRFLTKPAGLSRSEPDKAFHSALGPMGERWLGIWLEPLALRSFPHLTSPIHQWPADLPQQIVGVIWQDSGPDHDFKKETKDFQRKMIRFGSVLRMSVRRPLFVEVLNDGSTLASGIISVGCFKDYKLPKSSYFLIITILN